MLLSTLNLSSCSSEFQVWRLIPTSLIYSILIDDVCRIFVICLYFGGVVAAKNGFQVVGFDSGPRGEARGDRSPCQLCLFQGLGPTPKRLRACEANLPIVCESKFDSCSPCPLVGRGTGSWFWHQRGTRYPVFWVFLVSICGSGPVSQAPSISLALLIQRCSMIILTPKLTTIVLTLNVSGQLANIKLHATKLTEPESTMLDFS
jgi:hypothetical protein